MDIKCIYFVDIDCLSLLFAPSLCVSMPHKEDVSYVFIDIAEEIFYADRYVISKV